MTIHIAHIINNKTNESVFLAETSESKLRLAIGLWIINTHFDSPNIEEFFKNNKDYILYSVEIEVYNHD